MDTIKLVVVPEELALIKAVTADHLSYRDMDDDWSWRMFVNSKATLCEHIKRYDCELVHA